MIDVDDREHSSVALRLMPAQSLPDAKSRLPTRWEAVLFAGKAWCFRIRRWFHNGLGRRPALAATARQTRQRSRSPECAVPSDTPPERLLQAGKVQNLRSPPAIDGLVIPAGALSARQGRPSRRLVRARPRTARRLRNRDVGGGLTSSAMRSTTPRCAGCDIVERHAHSRRIEGSMAAQGRDATIF
jgi:hypothetical protein